MHHDSKFGACQRFARDRGQGAAAVPLLIGHGGLNQPLSQSDMLREQVATSIGQVSDEEIGRSTVTERIVVSVPAKTGIFVVLSEPSKTIQEGDGPKNPAVQPQSQSNRQELKQLLQLQRELNQGNPSTASPQ